MRVCRERTSSEGVSHDMLRNLTLTLKGLQEDVKEYFFFQLNNFFFIKHIVFIKMIQLIIFKIFSNIVLLESVLNTFLYLYYLLKYYLT